MDGKTIERSTAEIEDHLVPYTIYRENGRDTAQVQFDPDDGIVAHVPMDMPHNTVERMVTSKGMSLVEQLRKAEPKGRRRRQMQTGETYLFLGQPYRLLVDEGSMGEVHIDGAWLVVPVGDTQANKQGPMVRWKLVGWYRKQAEEQLPAKANHWAKALEVEPASVKVREHRRGWGACDARGNLRLNWRIVQAPDELIDYIVAHLMAMLVEDQQKDFWTVLGEVLPEYKDHQVALSRIERRLDW